MQNILINGNFLSRNLTGIERFSLEVCTRLDEKLSDTDDVSILVSSNARIIPQFKHIKIIRSKKNIKGFPFWDLGEFAKECRIRSKENPCTALNFSNTAPLGSKCGIAFIHDIYAVDFPKDFVTWREKLIRLYSILNYRNICHNAKKIITVSDFSRERIKAQFHIQDERIAVIGNGWEHFSSIQEDKSVFDKFPRLKKTYYFTLGSLSKRKNLSWIAKYAQNHTDEVFAISGKAINGMLPDELQILQKLENVVLVGYVTDEQVKALMKHCEAFIFPSYYEGFGIPPLEALSEGTKIIISKSSSLPEIYKDAAYYIDAYNPDCNIKDLLSAKNPAEILKMQESAKTVLAEYSYDRAAQKLYEILKEN